MKTRKDKRDKKWKDTKTRNIKEESFILFGSDT
jgi:hypothetical protein